MPQLDDIVQRVLLEGDDAIISAFERIGEKVKEILDDLEKTSQGGAGLTNIANAAVAVEGAFAIATAALITFANSTNEIVIQMNDLANSFGVTISQLADLEATFAAAGINSQSFARIIQRTGTTIANGWSDVTKQVRDAATEQVGAAVAIQNADLKVEEAQNALANGGKDRAAQQVANNNAVEKSTIALAFASSTALSLMQHNFDNVTSSNLSLLSAQQALATLQGSPPSASEQKRLQLDQARLAVANAEQAAQDALSKQQQDMAEAQVKQSEARAAADDAARKRDEDRQKALIEERKQIVALTEAENAAQEARNKQHELELTDLTKIGAALKSIGQQAGGTAGGIDLAEVSVSNITKAFALLTSEGGKAPQGINVLKQVADIFHNDTEHVITDAQRIAIASQFAGGSMRNMISAQFVHLLEGGSAALSNFADRAKSMGVDLEGQVAPAEAFRASMTNLEATLTLLKIKFTEAINPALTAFLDSINASIVNSDGIIHNFISGIEAIGTAISTVIGLFQQFAEWNDKIFDLKPGTTFKLLLLSLGVAIAAIASPFLAWPIIFGLVVTAVGAVVDAVKTMEPGWTALITVLGQKWDDLKAKIFGWIDSVKQGWTDLINDGWSLWDGLQTKLFGWVDGVVQKFKDGWQAIKDFWGSLFGGAGGSGGSDVTTVVAQGARSGGPIWGAGTSTSDSIPIFASVGEFMMQARAVQKYGLNFMHAINSLRFDPSQLMMALGGPVHPMSGARVKFAEGGLVQGARHVLNLTIGAEQFTGLMVEDQTMKNLTRFATNQQVRSGGKKPGWHR